MSDRDPDNGQPTDAGDYCRRVEDYLTRANGGHLVRIVGPGFALVRQWAADGIPLRIVFRGIDHKVERHRAGGSRRPLRIEFCEADVRDIYDNWTRAVGLTTRGEAAGAVDDAPAGAGAPPGGRRTPSMTKHLERALDRIVRTAGRLDLPEALRDGLTAVAADLAAVRESAKGARGAAGRDAIAPQLAALDRQLIAVVRATAGPEVIEAARRDAGQDLSAYRTRMTGDAWATAVDASAVQLLRDKLGLPTIEI